MSRSIRTLNGASPQLGERVFVDASAVVIGRVILGDDASVWPQTVIRGDVSDIRIGARSNVQDLSMLHVSSPRDGRPNGTPLIVGEDVTIGHRVILHACTIGDRVLVGMGAIVADDVVIEPDVLVGAGALVTPGQHLASRGLYLGNPARRARELKDTEIEMLAAMAPRYVRVKDEYLAQDAGGY